MVTLTKLNDVYKDWMLGDGVFTDLNNFDVPWKNDDNVSALNMAYHGSHSGDKNVSPIVYKFLTSEDENTRTKLANVIFTMFADKWSKLYDAMDLTYNPIENYSMTETETIGETTDNTSRRTGTETTTETGTDTHALSGKDTVKATGTDTNATTGTETTTMTGTDAHSVTGSDTLTKTGSENHSLSNSGSTTKTGSENHSLSNSTTTTKSGNIENDVSAFNSSDFEPENKQKFNNVQEGETSTGSDNLSFTNRQDSTTSSGSDNLTFTNRQDTHGKTETDTETRNMMDTLTHNVTDLETRNMIDETTFGRTDTETKNLTDQLTHNVTDDFDGQKDTERELTRSGNIGTLTTQAMLTSEIELRKWLFYESVFNDIDTILTLSIY